MFILKLVVKIILFPVFLMVCFVRTWTDLLAKIGCVILGFFYLIMLAIIIMYASKHMWGAVAISVGMSFAAFLVSFANDLSDAISVKGWASHELNIVISDDYISEEAQLIFNFTDIATNNRYVNAYTYNADSQICKIDYSLVFFHDKFIQFVD